MTRDELRIEALRFAQSWSADASANEIVSRAETYLKFLTSSTSSHERSAQDSEAPEKSCEVQA